MLEDGTFEWEDLTTIVDGTPPPARFDHHCFKYPVGTNSAAFDKIIVGGGRDLTQMFHDSYVFDVAEMKWETDKEPPCLPDQICMNLVDEVESVPHHKVFSFGGKTDIMMSFTNKMEVMDCGDLKWQAPVTEGEMPVPR